MLQFRAKNCPYVKNDFCQKSSLGLQPSFHPAFYAHGWYCNTDRVGYSYFKFLYCLCKDNFS